LSELVGAPVTYQQIPMEVLRKNSEDLYKMTAWFESTGYSVDIPSLEQRYGIKPLTFAEWVRAQRR
jgi:isocitrate dehydrogenase